MPAIMDDGEQPATTGNFSDFVDVNSIPPTRDNFIRAVVYMFYTSLGVPGNCMVILAVWRTKSLQNVSNAFVVNLAVADLLVCISMPLYIVSDLIHYYHPFLEPMCFVAVGIAHITVGCSAYSLAAISVNRFILILSPMKYYLKVFQRRYVIWWIALLWTVPTAISLFPPLALDVGRFAFDRNIHKCQSLTTLPTSGLYNVLIIFSYYPLSLGIVIFCYSGIFVKFWKHNRRLNRRRESELSSITPSTTTLASTGSETPAVTKSIGELQRTFRLQMKITKNMFYIFCTFIFCFSPHTICTGLGGCSIGVYTRMFIIFNSVLNPIIYGIHHPKFREVFKEMLGCKSRK